VLHVISQPDRPAGRGKHVAPTPVSEWAMGAGLPLARTENVNAPEMLELLRAIKPECLVAIAFGQKLSEELLAITPHRGINLHASLLPRYRGAAPINWAIIDGNAQAGVCVIELVNRMDAGDIFASAATPIGQEETAGELHDRLARLGAPLVPGVLDEMEAATVRREAQDEAAASKARKLSRELAWVDFTQPAALVSARMRGLSPWPGVQLELVDAAGKSRGMATVLKCIAVGEAVHAPDTCGGVLADRTVACGSGSLQIITVQPAGKKAMDLQAFANGYGFTPGARVKSIVLPPASAQC